MPETHVRGEPVRRFIIDRVTQHPGEIARVTAEHFGVTRQAVSKHLRALVDDGTLVCEGQTRNRTYRLAPLVDWQRSYALVPPPEEDRIWSEDVKPLLGDVPGNVMAIWAYGFTEMLNNAIDHAQGTEVVVVVRRTAAATEVAIHDDGVGIFKKIRAAMGLLDERHSVLELAKGKLTTDPARHAGEGIFFTSRMFDDFAILSGGVFFSHQFDRSNDWLLARRRARSGTSVFMTLGNRTDRTATGVFDAFTSDDDLGFTKTVVPVRLARHGDESLVSRSQAKRLLAGVERFRTVVLDFEGIDSVGQAFADEVFRVFPAFHPSVSVVPTNANEAVRKMIAHAQRGSSRDVGGGASPTTTTSA